MDHAGKVGDIKYEGPGIWIMMHRKALAATTTAKKEEFVKFIEDLIETVMKCPVCKKHAREYVDGHPISEYMNTKKDGRDIGMFMWTWNFHNAVNVRLNKKTIDLATAIGMYDAAVSEKTKGNGVCTTCNGTNGKSNGKIGKVTPRRM